MEEDDNKPAAKASDINIPDQVKGLFCEPPLLESEDPDLFWGFVAAVIAERKPETASDWIAVSDLVTNLWEERLLRRASNAVVRGRMFQRLGHWQAEEGEPEMKQQTYTKEEAAELQLQRAAAARRWIAGLGDKQKAREVDSLLARFGMTEPELYAQVFKDNSETLQLFERMIAARERRRRKLRKEDERRRRLQDMMRTKPTRSASQWPVKNSSTPTAKTPSGVQGRKPQPDA